MKKLLVICLIICFTFTAFAQQKEEKAKLPVKKVILYSHGMGYFERQGVVNGTQDIELEFTTSQMNDVLKSLLLLDLNGGQVSTVTYNTAKPINKQLESFVINLSANKAKSLTTLVGQLVGTRVEIKTNSSSIEGKVIGLEERQQQQANNIIKVESLVISTDTGMLESFDFTDIKGIRIIDRKIRSDIEQYLEILNTSHKKTARNLVINAQGSGDRNIVAGYTIEAPVWKTSYRVVLDEKGKPFIQGWAIVDNEQDEDWENVQLSLVSGLPVSFTQDLDSARYYTRPEVSYKQQVALAPQKYEENLGTPGAVAGVAAPSPEPPSPPPQASYKSAGRPSPKPAPSRTYQESLATSATNNTSGGELGDLFEYKINLPVTIRHNSSALIPIINSKLEGERISIFNGSSSIKNPMSGILLKNTSNLTLESGPLTVFEGSTYAGESLLDRIKPGEKRYLTFAADLGTFITTVPESSKDRVYLVKSQQGSLVLLSKQIETKTYTIVNKDARAKTVIIEHPRRQDWEIKSPNTKEVFEATENFLRFRVPLEAKATTKFPVVEEKTIEKAYQISNISSEDIFLFISQKYINEETRKKLQSIIDLKSQISATDSEIFSKNTQLSRIIADQGRLRENIKAIGKSEEEKKLLSRYTQKLNETEDQLEKLNIEIKALEETKNKQQQELNKMINSLDGYENKVSSQSKNSDSEDLATNNAEKQKYNIEKKSGNVENQIAYNKQNILNHWKPVNDRKINLASKGIALEPIRDISDLLVNQNITNSVNFVAECSVYLEKDALFDFAFRLNRDNFYFARFDSRPIYSDCILLCKNSKWSCINESSHHVSPSEKWLKMKLMVNGSKITLYQDGMLVDQVDNADISAGGIGIFAEVNNVYVDSISITPLRN